MTSDWQDFLESKKSGVKKHWKAILTEKVKYIDSLGENDQTEYLNNLCHRYFDLEETEIPIQYPDIWNKILNNWQRSDIWQDGTLLYWLSNALTSSKGRFQGAYLILNKEPIYLLRRILELDPEHFDAKKLIIEHHLHTLDFGMHSIDSGMLIDRQVGEEAIEECERLINIEPRLKCCKSMVGGDLEFYKCRFLAWYEYSKIEIDIDFDDWFEKCNKKLQAD